MCHKCSLDVISIFYQLHIIPKKDFKALVTVLLCANNNVIGASKALWYGVLAKP